MWTKISKIILGDITYLRHEVEKKLVPIKKKKNLIQ